MIAILIFNKLKRNKYYKNQIFLVTLEVFLGTPNISEAMQLKSWWLRFNSLLDLVEVVELLRCS